MKLNPSEIESTEEIGMLNGKPVRILKTKGGFQIAVGVPRGKRDEEALAAGSHRAVVLWNVEQKFNEFQPAMMKSESFSEKLVVEKHSHFLPEALRKSGHDIYSIQKGPIVNFHITKHEINVSSVKAQFDKQTLVLAELSIPKDFVAALAAATAEKAASCGALKVKVGAK
jgi:tRNA pseudouridine-54 N-methylase